MALVAFALLAGAPATSAAAVFYNVYRGTVVGGVDVAGDFGGSSLVGSQFYAIFKYDKAGSNTGAGPYNEQASGGPGTGGADPIMEATLTINGRTVAFPAGPGAYGSVDAYNLNPIAPTGYVASYVQKLVPGFVTDFLLMNVYNPLAPNRLETPFDGRQLGPSPALAYAYRYDLLGDTPVLRFDLELSPDRVIATADPGAAVPEPATWALLVGGFGLAGAALRRRGRGATGNPTAV